VALILLAALLGHPAYPVRSAADSCLSAFPHRPTLEFAVRSPDPETAGRAAVLLERLDAIAFIQAVRSGLSCPYIDADPAWCGSSIYLDVAREFCLVHKIKTGQIGLWAEYRLAFLLQRSQSKIDQVLLAEMIVRSLAFDAYGRWKP
jgi:hypothetical protein